MKKILKILAILIGIILFLFLCLAAFIQWSSLPTFENKAPQVQVTPDSSLLAEGHRLVSTLCAACHLSEDGKLGGKHMPDVVAFGEIYSSNITQHPSYGITDYTDGEIAYLIRTGIKRDGTYAPPWMVKLPFLSDEDMNAVISFLRSDHPLVQASDNQPAVSKLSFLSKALLKLGLFAPLPFPAEKIAAPNPADKIAYGRYLAVAKFDCYACHSADFKTNDYGNPEKSVGFFGGGNPIPDMEGRIILSANLTMDRETGLGDWTEEQFIKAVKYGVRPDKVATRYPMAPYARLHDEEVSAIWAYLQSLPMIYNRGDYTKDI